MTKFVSDIKVLFVLYTVIQKKNSVNGCFSINYIDIWNITIMIKEL